MTKVHAIDVALGMLFAIKFKCHCDAKSRHKTISSSCINAE